MSLINDVLKELDNKKSQINPKENALPRQLRSGRDRPFYKKASFSVLFGIVAFIIIFLSLRATFHWNQHLTAQQAKASSSVQKDTSKAISSLNTTHQHINRSKDTSKAISSLNTTHQHINRSKDTSKALSSVQKDTRKAISSLNTTHQHIEPTIVESNDDAKNVKIAFSKKPSSIKERIAQASQLVSNHDYDSAIALLDKPEIVQSNHVDAIKMLILVLTDTHHTQHADAIIHDAMLKHPNDPKLLYAKGYWLYQQKKVTQAIDLLQSHNPDIASNIDYYALLAQLFLNNREPGMASSLYQLIVSHQPNNAKWWLGLGFSLQRKGDVIGSQDAYQQALKLGNLPATTIVYLQKQLEKSQYNQPL